MRLEAYAKSGRWQAIGRAKKKITIFLQKEIHNEVEKITRFYLRDINKINHADLEATEMSIRSSMYLIGAKILEELINSDGGGRVGSRIENDKGVVYEFKEYRDKEVTTVLGDIKVSRAYYHSAKSGDGYIPKDKALDIEDTFFSPGVRRMMGRVGSCRPYSLGREDLKELAGISVDTKSIDRWSNEIGRKVAKYNAIESSKVILENVIPIKKIPIMYIMMDGTGVPMVKQELKDRKGKDGDGMAKTREAKLGCIFTQTTVDEEGYPIRDDASTSYVGAIETKEAFSSRIYAEAIRRFYNRAEKLCIIGDGAQWIWNIAGDKFKEAEQIIDLYHAREHYWSIAKVAFAGDEKKQKYWATLRRANLDSGKPERVIEAIAKLKPRSEEEKKLFEREMNYFENNKERMRYDQYRKEGLFVGSGVLEAGCKTVIGQRLKHSGMHWTVEAANNIIALRCCFMSNQWEDFWESRACC